MSVSDTILIVFEYLLKMKTEDYGLFLNKFYDLFFFDDIIRYLKKECITKICESLNNLEEVYSYCLEKITNFEENKDYIYEQLMLIMKNIIDYLVTIIKYDMSGQILYGKYLNNCIYIDKKQNNNIYEIIIWNKDNNQEQQQFIFNSEKEVENFFRENDMVVKWENVS